MPGKAVKNFTLPSTGGKTFRFSSTLGKYVALDLYPKDNTPGWTAERAASGRRVRAIRLPGHAEEVLNFVKAR
ncbi:MAG: redoxin domain-containing protein [Burkholderiales bacterium]